MKTKTIRTGVFGWLMLTLLSSGASLLAKVNVVATLPDFGSIAEAVGGELVAVTVLARGTEDPHFVDARPSFIRALNRADVLLEGGAELEVGWLPVLLNGARNPRIAADGAGHVVLSKGIRMLGVPSGPVDRSMGDVHPAGNPHYNLDPGNGAIMAATIADGLSRVDPANAEQYRRNARAFTERLDAKVKEWAAVLEPFRGTKVVTYHRSFDYLLERFGFELAGTVEPRPGIEPSPTHINALIPKMKSAGVKLILSEPNRPRKTAAQLAEVSGAGLVLLPGLVGGVPEAKDYVALFDYNVRLMNDALKAKSKTPLEK